jgi:type III secretion protein C
MVGQVHSLLARIRALEQHGDAQVLSKPMLLTTDNATALIDLSETFYTRVSGERTANLVPVTAGVMLKVTPHIVPTEEGADVQLTVDIEDGALQSRDGVELPVVKRSTVSTQAVIKGRSSLLIGGFNSQRNERVEQRVPLLGSLPWIGGAFRMSTVTDNNRERLFLITPTLISTTGAGPTPASTAPQAPSAALPLPALASNAMVPFPVAVTSAPPVAAVPAAAPPSAFTPATSMPVPAPALSDCMGVDHATGCHAVGF